VIEDKCAMNAQLKGTKMKLREEMRTSRTEIVHPLDIYITVHLNPFS
jgi:hypothetical protein